MLQNQPLLNSTLSSANETSANENGKNFVSNSNALRFYSPAGTRRRKASSSATLRLELCQRMQRQFDFIRSIKIKDTGIYFIARVRLRCGRTIRLTAYSISGMGWYLCHTLSYFA